MALPGLGGLPGLGSGGCPAEDAAEEAQTREIQLNAGSEWRFEVAPATVVSVTLLVKAVTAGASSRNEADPDTGTAEVFGTELAPGRIYEFPGLTKASIFTHHGCTLSISGTCESEYVAEETPMNEYLNVHFALENLRATAEASAIGGPRVLVLGPEDAGKTSLVKLLTAYATRSGRTPVVVNLDPHEGMLCLPGGLSAAAMGPNAVLDVEDAASNQWGSSPIGGPSTLPVKMPLVYNYGFAGPEERPEYFKPITTRLALASTGRFNDDLEVKESGMLVDFAGSACSGKKGSDLIAHVVSEYSINVILVLGSERLYSDMARRFASAGSEDEEAVHVLKLSKSGGCVERDSAYTSQLRQAQIRSYFFGTPKNTLSPHTSSVEFAALSIFQFTDPNSADQDFLPGGAYDDDDTKDSKAGADAILEVVAPSMAMQSALLAIKHASPSDTHDEIRDASVIGYLYVSDVDESRQRLKILSPAGGRLPNKAMIWGSWDVAAGMGDLFG